MYLGEQLIIKSMEDGDIVEITFENDEIIRMHPELFEMIKTETKVNQPYHYLINSVLATKFLEQMAKYGLEYSYVSPVAQAMVNLSFNLRDDNVAKKFGVEHPDDIQLNDLIKTK
jgi:ABC-type sulfate transport system substrate-binding protein